MLLQLPKSEQSGGIRLSKFMEFFQKQVSNQIGPQLALQLVSTLCQKEAMGCLECGASEPDPNLALHSNYSREVIRLFTLLDKSDDTVMTTAELSDAWGPSGIKMLTSFLNALENNAQHRDCVKKDCVTLRDWSCFWDKLQEEQGASTAEHHLRLLRDKVKAQLPDHNHSGENAAVDAQLKNIKWQVLPLYLKQLAR